MAFKPSQLKFDAHGVPYLTARYIEDIASEMLEKYCPHVLQRAAPTPVMSILENLQRRTGLRFTCVDLGCVSDRKLLGKVNFPTQTLYLDQSLLRERAVQMRFTAAHEIGHWVLHRYRPLRFKEKVLIDEITDDEDSICRLENVGPKDWIERQANTFAAALVLPTSTFQTQLVKAQRQIGITKNLGTIFVNFETYAQRDLQQVLAILAVDYGVSKKSVEVRLRTLKFMNDEAEKNDISISEIIKKRLAK